VASHSDSEYSGIVHGRGGLFFDTLRDEIGKEAFDAFTKDYTTSLTWDISTPEKLEDTAEKHCNCNLPMLLDEWIY